MSFISTVKEINGDLITCSEDLEGKLSIAKAELENEEEELASSKRILERIKANPKVVRMSARAETSDSASKRVMELEKALKIEERMRRDATALAIAREEELQKENEALKLQNEQMKKLIADLQQQLTCRPPLSPLRDG
ncbi:hypothetical protein GOP47_0030489 [Adiantum capillus-veneris]|nr:hypothetical protein GOP47_0030489 [Adiantum capillus-veneris]